METIVLTGASGGIGLVALRRLRALRPDAHLVLLGRRPPADPVTTGGRGATEHISCDLLSLRSLRSATNTVVTRLEAGELPPLRAVAANAGVQYVDDTTVSEDGFEATFAVNVLANHVLLRALGPRLERRGRAVVTVSDTHFGDFRHNLGLVPAPRWQSPERLARAGAFGGRSPTTAGRTAYSTSKLAAVHLVHEFARRLPDVDVIAFNPGFVPGTSLVRRAGRVSRLALEALGPVLTRTPIAFDVASSGVALANVVLGRTAASSGAYVDRDRVVPSSSASHDPSREAELWDVLEGLSGADGGESSA